jgi:hypothetical protein
MEKKSYEVTEKAGKFVAGRPSPGAGQPIRLTDEQAFYPLQFGEVKLATAKTEATEPVTAGADQAPVAADDADPKPKTRKA